MFYSLLTHFLGRWQSICSCSKGQEMDKGIKLCTWAQQARDGGPIPVLWTSLSHTLLHKYHRPQATCSIGSSFWIWANLLFICLCSQMPFSRDLTKHYLLIFQGVRWKTDCSFPSKLSIKMPGGKRCCWRSGQAPTCCEAVTYNVRIHRCPKPGKWRARFLLGIFVLF